MNDLRFAFRQLLKSPGFSATVVFTLALGIGANTAIFSVVHAVLLAPLPYPSADRIVAIQSRNLAQNISAQGFAPAGFHEFEKQVTSFEKVAASRYNYTNLTRVDKPAQLTDSLVTQDYFEVLGVPALLGRTFRPEDAAAGAKPTVVLSYRVWQSQFGGRADIIDQTIMLDDRPHTVIGVMPRTFKEPFNTASLWRMFPVGGENFVNNARYWNVLGRLKPDVPHPTVQTELATIAARLAQADAKFYAGWDFTLQPLDEVIVGNYRQGLLLVIGAALLVLLVTCANVAGLQLVRASTRQREIAVRLALGAGRWPIARQQLAESLLLVALGGIGGVLLGTWGVDLLLGAFSGGWIPRADEIAINTPVLAGTAAAAVLTGIASGLFPAWRATKVDAIDSLRDGAKGSAGPQSVRIRSALVTGQIAVTFVLLVCAGLVLKSFATILRVNPGMQVTNVLSMTISPAWTRYNTEPKRADYYRRLLERVSGIPGVEATAFTQTMPFTWGIPANFTVEGRADDAVKLPAAFLDSVSASFFATTRVPLLAGRTFNETDHSRAPFVAIINQTTARAFFPNEDPIGRRIVPPPPATGSQLPTPIEIIGVVGDVPRNGLNAAAPYQIYTPMDQRPAFFATLLVRSPLPVEALTRSVQQQIWSVDPDQPISNLALVRSLVQASLTQPRLYLMLFSLFAGLALLLAALGLYGLVAYSVTQRTREFGIRVALGAQAADLLRLVLGQGAKLTAAGLGVGLLVAAGVARVMESLLFRTTAYDPVVFATVVAVLTSASLLAALLPARKSSRVNPIIALRAE